MIDVDRFKAFNDTYGHPAGDEALRAISQRITTTLKRPADIAARYGGEELVALLPDTTTEGAARLGEEFRKAVRDLRIRHTGSEKGCVTVSIGVATSDRAGTKSAADLLRHADEALYNAKASGRDRLHEWAPPREAEPRKAG
jgi:diguanylate cyclase (GGDEF)-like protein